MIRRVLVFIAFISSSNVSATQLLRIGGSGTDLATIRTISTAFTKKYPQIQIAIPSSLGSGGAVKAVLADKLEIGLTSRPLKNHEKTVGIHAILYAKTPLVFAVASNNMLSDVNLSQLTAIYSGGFSYGPQNTSIRPVLRPKSDSDMLILFRIFPDLEATILNAYKRRGIPIAVTDQDNADLIASIPGGIGTSTLSLILAEKRPLKALTLNGVTPNMTTIANNSYPLLKELYIVYKGKPTSLILRFLKLLQSTEGRNILQNTGHQIIEFSLPAL